MSKKKINLLCYNPFFLRNSSIRILPSFLLNAFFLHNGRKQDLFVVSSHFLHFLTFSHFISSTRFGRIHTLSKKKTAVKKKKK